MNDLEHAIDQVQRAIGKDVDIAEAFAAEKELLLAMQATLDSAQIAQSMASKLLNAVLFLGIANVVLMAALIIQATR
jgi:hypothetical protein